MFWVFNQLGSPRTRAVKNVLLQILAKRFAHFGERPMRRWNHFKAPRQTFDQAALNEKRRRAKQYHSQGNAGMRVGVSKHFHRTRPVGDFLDLVEHEQRVGLALLGLEPSNVLLLL